MLINNNLIENGFRATNAMHNDILDFSNNTHHIYFSLLKLKPIFQAALKKRGG